MSLCVGIASGCPIVQAMPIIDLMPICWHKWQRVLRRGQRCRLIATLEDALIPVAAVGLPGLGAAIERRSGWAAYSNTVTTSSAAEKCIGRQPMRVGACMRVQLHITSSTLLWELSLNPSTPEQMERFKYFRVPSSFTWCIVRLLGFNCRDGGR